MSLSRYYKNAPSFQAEDLVKQDNKKPSSRWAANPGQENRPFQSQKISSSASTTARPAPSEEAPVLNRPNDDEKNNATNSLSPPVPPEQQEVLAPLAPEDPVDLNNYIERNEAENQIAEAYRQGIQEGIDKTEEDFGAATRALLLICQQLDTLRATIIANSSKQLQEFALAIAEKILRLSVHEQDHTIIATIEEALRRAVKSDEFTIHIHPEDYETVAAKSPEIIAGISGLNNIVVRKDKHIERGGARIESDNCTIDATISSQFETIREEVQKNL